jgi:hypothetical protein
VPRYISFMLTQPQIRSRTKTVTRRLGWEWLKPGTLLMGAEKCQGLGKGGKIKPLGLIRVVDVRREALGAITWADCVAEGFPEKTPRDFIYFFCSTHKGCAPQSQVTRIQFEYVN